MQTAAFYDRFSVWYPLINIFLKPQKKKLFHEINNLPFGQLLEVGVGNGEQLRCYKTHQIIGIDTSLKMLGKAKKHETENIKLMRMNGEQLLFENKSFDYVVLCHVIAVVDNPGKLLEEIYRVLKPGGKVFILNHFTPDNWVKYIDSAFHIISKIFHFRSVFHIGNFTAIQKFKLENEISLSHFAYFKLLIYAKE